MIQCVNCMWIRDIWMRLQKGFQSLQQKARAGNLTVHVILRALEIRVINFTWIGSFTLKHLWLHITASPARLPATSPSVDNNDSAHQKGRGGQGRTQTHRYIVFSFMIRSGQRRRNGSHYVCELRVFCLVSRLYYCYMTYNVAGFTANQSQITMVELVPVRLRPFRPFRCRVVSCSENFDPPCCLSRTNNLLVIWTQEDPKVYLSIIATCGCLGTHKRPWNTKAQSI